MATIFEEVTLWIGANAESNATDGPERFVPEMVTSWPPASGPAGGVTVEM